MSRERGLPPPPREIERLLRAHVDELARLLVEYRWLHAAAYGQPSGGDSGYTTGSRDPDRTGSLVGGRDRAAARRAMIDAREKILNATSQVQEAEVNLGHALPRLQRRPTLAPENVERTISTAEFKKSQEAQERRLERGEGFGDG